MKMEMVKVSALVEDLDLYPRSGVDGTHVQHIVEAMEAGTELPPIVVCGKTKRIVDGVHRTRAARRFGGDDAEIPVVWRYYTTDAELFLDAMRLNASHGRNMSSFDRTVAIGKAVKFKIDLEHIASALNITVEKVATFRTERVSHIENTRSMVGLKMPIRHMAGRTFTREQAAAVPSLGGNNQTFYVNQLITLIETHMLDTENEKLISRLRHLHRLIEETVLHTV